MIDYLQTITPYKDNYSDNYLRSKDGHLFITFLDITNAQDYRLRIQNYVIKNYGATKIKDKEKIKRIFCMYQRDINREVNIITIHKLKKIFSEMEYKNPKGLQSVEIEFIWNTFVTKFKTFNVPEIIIKK